MSSENIIPDPRMVELGRIAYDAYCDARDWKSVSGHPLPKFENQSQELISAWCHAALAVREHIIMALPARAVCVQSRRLQDVVPREPIEPSEAPWRDAKIAVQSVEKLAEECRLNPTAYRREAIGAIRRLESRANEVEIPVNGFGLIRNLEPGVSIKIPVSLVDGFLPS